MARTFTTIQTEALGNDFSSSVFPGTMAGTYINDALKELARRLDLPTMETRVALSITSGTQTVNLPTDFVHLISVFDETDDTELTEVETERMDELGEGTGTPDRYSLSGSQITLYPVPDTTSTTRFYLRYRALPADISGSTGITGTVPDDYGPLLVAYARAEMFAFEDDAEMVAFWDAKFESGVKRLRGDLGLRKRVKRQIPGMWGRGTNRPFARRP